MDNNQYNQGQQSNYYDSPYSQSSYSQQPVNSSSVPSGLALAAMICGIAGFVTGPGVSIAALVLSSMCKKRNNGQHVKKSKIGFGCGLGSLIMWIVVIIFYIIYFAVFGALLADSLNY